MSDETNPDLPEDVRDQLPVEAQAIYRDTFNRAWRQYGRSPRDETRARAMAWAAVKKQFHEDEHGQWMEGPSEERADHPPHIDERYIF